MACELAKLEGNVCQNGGKCRNVEDTLDYLCDCPHGWTGKHCEMKDVSAPYFSSYVSVEAFLCVKFVHSYFLIYVANGW